MIIFFEILYCIYSYHIFYLIKNIKYKLFYSSINEKILFVFTTRNLTSSDVRTVIQTSNFTMNIWENIPIWKNQRFDSIFSNVDTSLKGRSLEGVEFNSNKIIFLMSVYWILKLKMDWNYFLNWMQNSFKKGLLTISYHTSSQSFYVEVSLFILTVFSYFCAYKVYCFSFLNNFNLELSRYIDFSQFLSFLV